MTYSKKKASGLKDAKVEIIIVCPCSEQTEEGRGALPDYYYYTMFSLHGFRKSIPLQNRQLVVSNRHCKQ